MSAQSNGRTQSKEQIQQSNLDQAIYDDATFEALGDVTRSHSSAYFTAMISGTTDMIEYGEIVDVELTVRNDGGLTSVPRQDVKLSLGSPLVLLDSTQPTTTTPLGTFYSIPALKGGESISWTISVQLDPNVPISNPNLFVTLAQPHGFTENFLLSEPISTARSAAVTKAKNDEDPLAAPSIWQPQIFEPTVAEFAGSATYFHPFDIPDGRGGISPKLGLSYDSSSANGAGMRDSGDIAEGWSLTGVPFIYRSNMGLCDNDERYTSQNIRGALLYGGVEEFQLNLNGSFKLVDRAGIPDLAGTTADGQYDAENAPGLFIQRQDYTTADGGVAQNDYWIVKTPDGTTYRFGQTDDAKQTTTYAKQGSLPGNCGDAINSGENGGKIVIRYWLDRVIDVDGNVMVVEYATSVANGHNNIASYREVAVFPKTVYYNNKLPLMMDDPINETDFASRVDLVWHGRGVRNVETINDLVWKGGASYIEVVGIRRLTEIYVTHMDELAWVYSLEREKTDEDDPERGADAWVQLELTDIRKCYPDEVTTYESGDTFFYCENPTATPPTHFEYEPKATGNKPWVYGSYIDENGEEQADIRYADFDSRFLKRVHNGYGGVHEFVYSNALRIDAEDNGHSPDNLRSYFVEEVKVWDGYHDIYSKTTPVPPTTVIDYHYRFDDACFTYSMVASGDSAGESRIIVSLEDALGDVVEVKENPLYCGTLESIPIHVLHTGGSRYQNASRKLVGFKQVVTTVHNDEGEDESIVRKGYSTAPGGFSTGDLITATTYYNEQSEHYLSPSTILADNDLPTPPIETVYQNISSEWAIQPILGDNGDIQYDSFGNVRDNQWWCSHADLAVRTKCQGSSITRRYDPDTGGKNETFIWNFYDSSKFITTTQGTSGIRQLGLMTGQRAYTLQDGFNSDPDTTRQLTQHQLTHYLLQRLSSAEGGGWLAKPWRQQLLDIDQDPNTVWRQQLLDIEQSGTVMSEMLFLYDGNRDADEQTFTKGKVTAQLAATGDSHVSTQEMIETGYVYDETQFGVLRDTIQYEMMSIREEEDGGFAYPAQTEAGRVASIDYDWHGLQISTVTNPLNHTVSATYHAGRPWLINSITDPNGATSTYQYDDYDRLTGVFAPDPVTGELAYDPVTGEPKHQTVAYEYTIGGLETWQGYTLNTVRIDEIVAPSDPTNTVTNTTFLNGLGAVEQTWTYPVEISTMENGTLTKTETLLWADVGYDALGRPICSMTPHTGDPNLFGTVDCLDPQYDDSIDRTLTTYDALGRVFQTIGVDGATTTQTYAIAADGHDVQTVIDPNGNKKKYETDVLGRLRYVHEFDVAGMAAPYATTEYSYDQLDRLTTVIDAHSNTTSIQYNALGLKTQMDDPDMGRWTYQYDLFGNLSSQTDNKNQTLCFEYDPLQRMIEKRLLEEDEATVCAPDNSRLLAAFEYDRAGSIGMMRSEDVPGVTTREWFYDLRGRMTDEIVTIANPFAVSHPETFTATYTYDDLNRPTTLTYPDGEVVTTAYGRGGAAVGLSGDDVYVADAHYNMLGQMRALNLGNGVETLYEYGGADNTYRLLNSSTSNGTQLIQEFAYTYDNVGNILGINGDYLPSAGAASLAPDVETFTYDGLYRLKTAQGAGAFAYDHASTPELEPGLEYVYDEVGNITQYKGRIYNYETTHANCDTDSDAVTTQPLPHAVRQIEEDYFCYDANGNMIERHEVQEDSTTTTYTQEFDAENRLTTVKHDLTTFQFAYDATGGRVSSSKDDIETETITFNPFPFFEIEQVTEVHPTAVLQNSHSSDTSYPIHLLLLMGTLLSITLYLRKRHRKIGKVALILVIGCIGVTTLTPTPILQAATTESRIERKTYIMGGAIAQHVDGSDDTTKNGLFYLHTNHLGSISAMTDVNGELVENSVVRFLPFGEYRPNSDMTASPTELGFTGHKQNDDIGLIYMNARYYVPSIGRFASADTIVPVTANPQSFNRYSYVYNNPVNHTDPSGHIPVWVIQAGTGATTELVMQVAVSYFFDPDVNTIGQAFGNVNWWQVASAGGEAVIPGNISPVERAMISGAMAVATNWATEGGNYSLEQAMKDFAVGFLSSLGGDLLGDLIAKHGKDVVVNGLRKMGASDKMLENFGLIARQADEGGMRCDCNSCRFNSFSKDTLVMTQNGEVPISEIEVGDLVLAYHEGTDTIGYYPVTDLISHIDPVIVLLTVDGEVIETTPEHPFYEIIEWHAWGDPFHTIALGIWVDAEHLTIDDTLVRSNGSFGTVENIEIISRTQRMYNFTVDKAHTYFVGGEQWLVHNARCYNDLVRWNRGHSSEQDEAIGEVVSYIRSVKAGRNVEKPSWVTRRHHFGKAGDVVKDNSSLNLPDGTRFMLYDVSGGPAKVPGGRGSRRLAIGDDGSVLYTNEHYNDWYIYKSPDN